MNKDTAIPLAKTLIRRVLRIKNPYTSGGNTLRSRYCYSVWMRHLGYWSKHKQGVPRVVAELGPGSSLGIGFCILKVFFAPFPKIISIKSSKLQSEQ